MNLRALFEATNLVTGADPRELTNEARFVHARVCVAHILRDPERGWSLAQIGRALKQHHTTVVHALKKPRPAECDQIIAAMGAPRAADPFADSSAKLVKLYQAMQKSIHALAEAAQLVQARKRRAS